MTLEFLSRMGKGGEWNSYKILKVKLRVVRNCSVRLFKVIILLITYSISTVRLAYPRKRKINKINELRSHVIISLSSGIIDDVPIVITNDLTYF